MAPSLPAAAADHYQHMQRLQAVTVAAGRRAWRRVDVNRISESWVEAVGELVPVVSGAQANAAASGATYSAMTLAQQGVYVPPVDFVDPQAFAGRASDGRGLNGLLYSPAPTAKAAIAAGAAPAVALQSGQAALEKILSTVVADAARQAAGADIANRQGVGYVRMLNPPSCDRCTILAGRFYRWNAGFLRHPQCDCVHVASTAGATQAAIDEGLIDDPYEYFHSLPTAAELDEKYPDMTVKMRREAGLYSQEDVLTKAGAQALRDGADISQVVNARRGMTANGNFTVEGTTKRGYAHSLLNPGQRRMTPESIYEGATRWTNNETDRREMVQRLLREHGYVLPEGQIAGGSLRGQREGFGQLGRGGTRKAASQAVLDARATGVRDPNNRYTMTAAERRLYDAQRRYEVALSGVSPYRSSPGFGQTPDPYGLGLNRVGGPALRPVTPVELATAEREYRALLASAGQIFTR